MTRKESKHNQAVLAKDQNLFFSPQIEGQLCHFTEEESLHIIRALRKSKGDLIMVTNGNGCIYEAQIIDANPKSCLAEVGTPVLHSVKKETGVHIAISLIKNTERFEWFVEKATEIGIDIITPLICARTEKIKINQERILKIMISSMKQSFRPWLPELNPLVSFKDFVLAENNSQKFIADCSASEEDHLKVKIQKSSGICVLIGPEGDFTSTEKDLAKTHNYISVSLGANRLRTETAGIVACHLGVLGL